MEINKPIFIIGVARSGTTILSKLFTQHKDTAYFENYSSRYYRKPWMFRFIPMLMKYQKFRYGIDRPEPSEGWVFDRFYRHLDYLDEKQVTNEIKKYYTNAIKYQLKAFNAKRFVNKNPRSCLRIRWLNEMFPDAFYIAIWREPKSIISSMYEQLKKWENNSTEFNKVHSERDSGYGHIIEKLGKDKSQIETCFNYYNCLKNGLDKDLEIVSDRLIKLDYEDFVKEPKESLKKLYNFVELKWYPELERKIPNKLKQDNNEKWKKLPIEEREILEKSFPN